ncbi:inner membrane protein YhjD [Pseudonocardiaceae bacterium YIM PH 21723]|nr:inner membrane protein YhjD [Pseudonocardiaceae bacterium YIM PH 21723]
MISRWITRVEQWFTRRREQNGWLNHLIKAAVRYDERNGDRHAAAVTYFSVLSLVPMLMVGFSIAGFVLFNNPRLMNLLRVQIIENVPGSFGDTLLQAVDRAIDQSTLTLIIGLVVAIYTGLGWMENVRDALTAQYESTDEERSVIARMAFDLMKLFGLGLAILIVVGITVAGGGLSETTLGWLGYDPEQDRVARWVLKAATLALSLVATFLMFLWIYYRLPRRKLTLRSSVHAAITMAVISGIFSQVGGIYLRIVTKSPSGAAFGSVLGVLVFIYLSCRLVLLVMAWAATSEDNEEQLPIPVPTGAVIKPIVEVRSGPDGRTAAGLIGVGALSALIIPKLFRRGR